MTQQNSAHLFKSCFTTFFFLVAWLFYYWIFDILVNCFSSQFVSVLFVKWFHSRRFGQKKKKKKEMHFNIHLCGTGCLRLTDCVCMCIFRFNRLFIFNGACVFIRTFCFCWYCCCFCSLAIAIDAFPLFERERENGISINMKRWFASKASNINNKNHHENENKNENNILDYVCVVCQNNGNGKRATATVEWNVYAHTYRKRTDINKWNWNSLEILSTLRLRSFRFVTRRT